LGGAVALAALPEAGSPKNPSKATGSVAPPALSRDSQLDPVIRRMNKVLARSEVPLGSLHRCVAQQQLDLLQLTARGSA